jgi:hypothetical protein
MTSRQEFQQDIDNRSQQLKQETGITMGRFTLARFRKENLSNESGSTWLYALGLNISDSYNNPHEARTQNQRLQRGIPHSVLAQMPILSEMFDATQNILNRHIANQTPAHLLPQAMRDARLVDAYSPLVHPHFGVVPSKQYWPFIRTLPVPAEVCGQVGTYSVESVERPDNNKWFTLRHSFIFQESEDHLRVATFNREVDETWPNILTERLDTNVVNVWSRPPQNVRE